MGDIGEDGRLSEADVAFVDDLLAASGETARWCGWVSKTKHGRVQTRILVVTEYRIVTIKSPKMGKRTVRRRWRLGRDGGRC